MKNHLVSEILYEIADLLDVRGDIFFKTRAYRIAAQTIEVLDEDIKDVSNENRLTEINGVGEALAKKIKEIVDTGGLKYLEELKKEIPEDLLKMLNIPGLGPRKVSALYKNLNITTIEELKKACNNGKLRNLDGFGETTEKNILRGIKLIKKTSGRVLLNVAYNDGNIYLTYLKKCKDIDEISIAGSLRRMKETIGDLDILASSQNPEKVMNYFVKFRDVQRVLLKGSTKTSVLLNDDIQVDLRVVSKESFGAALQYFTGSKEHNVKMRGLAIKKGYKLNEYGLFDKENEKYIIGRRENEIYKKLGLEYIEPELRENRGEIEIASKNKLPNLVGYNDIKGDIHVHSVWSDGIEKIETIANYCKKLGYEYIGITDHSQSLKVARGLTENMVDKKRKEIEKLNEKIKGISIFCGTECDIKADGTLDYNDKILKKFDYVFAGIHLNFKMNSDETNKRIIKAMENEYVKFLAHPSCRLIGRREPLQIDIEKISDTARETNTILEINSFPDRLDLNDYHTKIAKDRGAGFVISTDAHNLNHLDFIMYGIATARRGWLEKKDIINTYTLDKFNKFIGK
jgi:DNA polymerase (family 10)